MIILEDNFRWHLKVFASELLISSVTEWILGTETPLVVLTYYDGAWHVVSWKQHLVASFRLSWAAELAE